MSKPLPVLIMQLRPEDLVSDSEYACILKYGGLKPEDTHRLRVEKNGIPENLNLDDYSAIIVGGSPFDISTPENDKSPIQKKIEANFNTLLDAIVKRDFPFLGACSGNGLLGSHLGSEITRKYGETTSCVSLNITPEGKKDKLLKGFPDSFYALLGHKEAVDETPKGATLLVTGKACPIQMFRVGENVYATQFHPEGDAEEFQLRIDIYKNHGYFKPHEAEELKENVSSNATPYSQEILKRFIDFYYA